MDNTSDEEAQLEAQLLCLNLKTNRMTEDKMTTDMITFEHQWAIEHVDVYCWDESPWRWKLWSDRFAPPSNEVMAFGISCKVKNENDSEVVYLAINVVPHNVPTMWKTVVYWSISVAIVDENGRLVNTKESDWTELDSAPYCSDFIKLADLLDGEKRYLLDGKRLLLDVKISLRSTDCEPIFVVPSSTLSSPPFSHSDALSPVYPITHTFTIEHFSLLYHRNDCLPYFLASNYLAPDNELVGRLRIQLYPNELNVFDELEGENDSLSSYESDDDELNYSDDDSDDDHSEIDKLDQCLDRLAITLRNENKVPLNVLCTMSILRREQEMLLYRGCSKVQPNDTIQKAVSSKYVLDELLVDDKLTIRWKVTVMVDSPVESHSTVATPPDASPTMHFSSSAVDVAQYQIDYAETTWPIRQFKERYTLQRGGISLNQQFESSSAKDRFRFALKLYPPDGSEDCWRVSLWNAVQLSEETYIQFSIEIIDADRKVWPRIEAIEEATIGKVGEYGLQQLINHRTLLANSDSLLPKGTLTLTCWVWIFQMRLNYSPELLYPSEEIGPGALIINNNTLNLPHSSMQSVILGVGSTIETDNVNLRVATPSSSTSGVGSTVTSRTLSSGTANTSQRATIATTATTSSKLTASSSTSFTQPLYSAQSSWKELTLTPSNAAEYLYLAYQQQNTQFQSKIIKFIIGKNCLAVLNSDGWKQYIWPNPHLSDKIIEMLHGRAST